MITTNVASVKDDFTSNVMRVAYTMSSILTAGATMAATPTSTDTSEHLIVQNNFDTHLRRAGRVAGGFSCQKGALSRAELYQVHRCQLHDLMLQVSAGCCSNESDMAPLTAPQPAYLYADTVVQMLSGLQHAGV
jgi:hypothetical protein